MTLDEILLKCCLLALAVGEIFNFSKLDANIMASVETVGRIGDSLLRGRDDTSFINYPNYKLN